MHVQEQPPNDDVAPRFRTRGGEFVGGNIKGAAFREMILWMEANVGKSALSAGYDHLRPEHRAVIDPDAPAMGIVTSTWYPQIVAQELAEAACDARPDYPREETIRDFVRYQMDKTLRGIYRMLFELMVTPERASKHIQRMWRLHYDTGQVTWNVEAPGLMRAAMHDWPGHSRDGCEMLRQAEIYYLVLMGCKGVNSMRTACVARGHEACVSRVTWVP